MSAIISLISIHRRKTAAAICIVLTWVIIITTILHNANSRDVNNARKSDEPFTFFITSDTHYLSQSLYDDSQTFRDFMNEGDGKMLDYSDTIIRAFVDDAIRQKPDAVIISGDLTLNGEEASHRDLSKILASIKNAGIKVLVIPGNHDINNPYAREIKSDGLRKTAYTSPAQFAEIYNDFGYKDAVSRDTASLSYISELADGVYVFMLDTCMYEDNIEKGGSQTRGEVRDETIVWLNNSIRSIKAENKDAKFITVMHHNLFVHNKNFERNFVVNAAESIQGKFREAGLGLFFSGHIHIQDILTDNTDDQLMTEVINSSLIVYPVAYGVAEIENGDLNYHTQWVDMEAYAIDNNLEDKNLYEFEQHAEREFNERSGKTIASLLRSMDSPEEDAQAAVTTLKLMNRYYFAGNIDRYADELRSSKGYEVLAKSGLVNEYIQSIFEGGTGENNKLRFKL